MSTLEPGNSKCSNSCNEQTPAGIGKVDARLGVLACVTHHLVEKILIVGEERIPGHLSEESEESGDENTTAHTRGTDHVHPGLLAVSDFDLDSLLDLGDFGFDQDGGSVVFGVVLDEDSMGFVVSVSTDEPSG